MPSVINTNISSLNAQRNLTTSQSSLATSLQRLSSGLRINSAKDDAAGLAISERFTTQIRGMNVAVRNANDGISLAQSAEGAMTEIGNNLQRIRELAVQSRNATNSDSDREALQAEAEQLKSEISRVASTTAFNDTKLLDGSFTAKAFQVGANQGETIDIAEIADARIDKLGNWNSVATSASITGGVPVGTTTNTPGSAALDLSAIATTGDPSSTGFAAMTIKINGGADINITATGFDTDAATTRTAFITKVAAAINANTDPDLATVSGTDVNLSNTTGSAIAITSATPELNATVAAQTSVTTFDQIADGALTINSIGIGAVAAASTASQRANALVTAINAKTSETDVTASLKDGKLVLASSKGDITIGGTVTGTGLTAGSSTTLAGSTAYVAGEAKVGFSTLDISTTEGADNAIKAMDAALTAVNTARARMGAVQNRFSSVVASLQTTSENMSASRSRILDADFAAETANLTRGQILQQAGTAMLAQANSLPNSVLSLLRG